MPATENLVNKTEWSTLTGLILDGGYEMKEPLELEDASALFKIRILGSNGEEAMVRLYHADLAQAEEQLSFWQTLREWPHPNVVTPLAAGYRWLGDVGVVYVVLPTPDEKLSGVLSERALTEEEATEVTRNIGSALGHLHACGLTHGSISPDAVLAVRQSIQISVDSVRRQGADLLITPPAARYLAPESEHANTTPASDVWCMGATLFEILTQQHYETGIKEQTKTPHYPLLLQRCLEENPETRCTLTEALAIFARGPKAAPLPPAPVIPEPVAPVPTPLVAVQPDTDHSEEKPAEGAAAEEKDSAVAAAADAAEPVVPQPDAADGETPKRATIFEMPEPESEDASESSDASTTGAAARVAAAEEFRKAAAAGDAFRKARSASGGTNSILSAPLPTESRHKPAETRRKPVASKIRHVGTTEASAAGTGFAPPKFTTAGAELASRSDLKSWGSKSKPRTWQLAVAGAFILILFVAVIFLVVVPRLESPVEPVGPAQSGAASGAKGNAWQTKTLAPGDSARAVASAPAHPTASDNAPSTSVAKPAAGNSVGDWRLVLYSYRFRQDAERRILLLKRNHPNMDARLFVPVKKWPFMVVMGGPMSKDAAEDLKKQAIVDGLPRAIYVQKF